MGKITRSINTMAQRRKANLYTCRCGLFSRQLNRIPSLSCCFLWSCSPLGSSRNELELKLELKLKLNGLQTNDRTIGLRNRSATSSEFTSVSKSVGGYRRTGNWLTH